MKITFHGAARRVTGSKFLLTLENNTRILLDCGMFQGEGPETRNMNRHFGFSPHDVDILVLSHAHIDHSGLIPRLVSEGFKGKIYSTAATKDLCGIMLEDSAEIQEDDARHLEKRGIDVEPLYTVQDTKDALRLFETIHYNQATEIAEGVKLTFTDAGHIIGSAVVNLEIQEAGKTKRLCFTADVGRYDRRILRDPQPCPPADLIICESTYGDSLHQSRDEAEHLLRQAVIETCGLKKGKLIIPAFSLGRTQDLIYILNKLDFDKKIPAFDVFIDSPLATDATEIVARHDECFDDETLAFMKKDPELFHFPTLKFVQKASESRKLNDYKRPCIIIASSGMLDAGRIRHHIIHNIEDERNTIMLTSYAEPDSLGGRLKAGDKKVEIWGKIFDVKANIIALDGLSAHGDQAELIKFLDSSHKKEEIQQLFLVHGEYEKQLAFKDKLQQSGYKNVVIPAHKEEFWV